MIIHKKHNPHAIRPLHSLVANRSRHKSLGYQCRSVGQNGPHQIGVVDLAGGGINRLEELIDFVIGHFLAEVGEDCQSC